MADSAAPPPVNFEYPPLHGGKLLFLTAAIATASFMEILDMTIVNVSVPAISGSMGVSTSEGTWAVSSYMLAAAIMQPLTGWIGRRFGEVRTFVSSILLFMVFSAVCGLATSMPMLVAARLIQGLVSGPMMSVAQAILLRNYPSERRGMAIALWSMVIMIAPICGPILGGWITDNLSWPWLFYINLPVGAFSAIASWSILRKRESKIVKLPIDSIGLALLVIGVGSLQFMLDNGNEKDWFSSPAIIAAAITSIVALSFFIPWELTDKHPVVDLHLFAGRNFRVGTLVVGLSYFALSGVNIIFPLWLQTTVGYTSTWAGLAVAPVGLLALVAAPFVGRNMNRLNLRLAASFAFVVFGGAIFWTATLNDTASFAQFATPRFLQGLGIAFFFLPLNQILMSGVAPNELASASGVSNFVRTMSGSFATAITVWAWNRRTDYHHAVLTEHIRNSSDAWTQYQAQLSTHGISATGASQYVDLVISGQASTMGVNDVFNLLGLMYLFLIPLVWFAKPPFGAMAARSTR
ncbi:MAG: transporter, family, multidrug resistance protein [Gammaproteobacteria bacterium]|jgi:MFS transporter, DHA2 family, multidrug resistance protein|nr:transporter, family, multidrug resistance protein [Gammaproteobacteria bacterium]